MQVKARYLDKSKFEVTARQHRLICDQPGSDGSPDAGMSPPELLLASLAACAGYYAAQYLKARGLPGEGLAVDVTAEKALQPARLASFRVVVTVPGVEPRHQTGILRSVATCLIHKTLLRAPQIDIVVDTPVRALASTFASLP